VVVAHNDQVRVSYLVDPGVAVRQPHGDPPRPQLDAARPRELHGAEAHRPQPGVVVAGHYRHVVEGRRDGGEELAQLLELVRAHPAHRVLDVAEEHQAPGPGLAGQGQDPVDQPPGLRRQEDPAAAQLLLQPHVEVRYHEGPGLALQQERGMAQDEPPCPHVALGAAPAL
jgi:hypothetical protein